MVFLPTHHIEFAKHPVLLAALLILVLLNVLDVLLTRRILGQGGVEANPIARLFMRVWPSRPWVGLVLLKLCMFVALHVAFMRVSFGDWGLMMFALLFVYGYVVIHNLNVAAKLELAEDGGGRWM